MTLTPAMLDFLARLNAWRALSRDEQESRFAAAREHRPPGILARAGALASAAVAFARDDFRLAPDEVRAERKALCFACPRHVPPDGCTACGCGVNPALSFIGLDLELKRSLASSRCPDDPPRWRAV